jgi:hypothetical protein
MGDEPSMALQATDVIWTFLKIIENRNYPAYLHTLLRVRFALFCWDGCIILQPSTNVQAIEQNSSNADYTNEKEWDANHE